MKNKCISNFFKYSPISALSLNFLGAVLIIFSQGTYVDEGFAWISTDAKGRALEAIYLLYPTMFKIGIWLIAIGFFFQVINELFKLRRQAKGQ